MIQLILLALSLIIMIPSAPLEGFADSEIYIGILPYYAPEKIWHLYRPFIAYLNKTTGLNWDIKLYHSYEALAEGICNGEVSIAYLGPYPFGIAYERCKVRPLIVVLGEDGMPYYRSIIFTTDKGISSVKEIKGKTFAFGDRDSTSSFIIPRKILEDNGITLDMIKPLFLKSHEKIIEAVATNNAIAGATKVSVFEKFRNLGFKTLEISDPLPHHCFCAASIGNDIEKRFVRAMLKLKPLNNPKDRDLMKNWDPELQHGFTFPPFDYIKRISELHKLYRKYSD